MSLAVEMYMDGRVGGRVGGRVREPTPNSDWEVGFVTGRSGPVNVLTQTPQETQIPGGRSGRRAGSGRSRGGYAAGGRSGNACAGVKPSCLSNDKQNK